MLCVCVCVCAFKHTFYYASRPQGQAIEDTHVYFPTLWERECMCLWSTNTLSLSHWHTHHLPYTPATWAKKILGMMEAPSACCNEDQAIWEYERESGLTLFGIAARGCVRVCADVSVRECAFSISLMHLPACACTRMIVYTYSWDPCAIDMWRAQTLAQSLTHTQ